VTAAEREAVATVADVVDAALLRGLDDPAASALALLARQVRGWRDGRLTPAAVHRHLGALVVALGRLRRGATVEAFERVHARVLARE